MANELFIPMCLAARSPLRYHPKDDSYWPSDKILKWLKMNCKCSYGYGIAIKDIISRWVIDGIIISFESDVDIMMFKLTFPYAQSN